jgi:hypothetical protein
MKPIHADNKKKARRENQSVVYDARQHFIRKRTRVRFSAVNALKENQGYVNNFFPMITAIIRKPTPTIKTIHDDDKKWHAEKTNQWFTTLDDIFIRKTYASPISRRECTKKKSRKLKQFFR